MKQFIPLYFALFLILFSGTACMRSTSLEVLRPAAFSVPEDVSAIATVNRSRPKNKVGNVIEGLFTGEAIGQDKAGARRATEGLSQILTRTPRFTVTFTGIEMVGKGSFAFPEPLSWAVVDSICRKYGTDGLASIEKFDSDTRVQTNAISRTRKDDEGNEIRYTVYEATQRTEVTLGWRLYDPIGKVIIDEFEVTEFLEWTEDGASESQARNALPNQVRAVEEVSYAAGQKYGMRIAPTWIEVSRDYYSKAKGSDAIKMDMKKAARLAVGNQWREAARIWKPIAEDANYPKAAGRAAYNMALAAEWEGRLQTAHKWATKAYVDYGNKNARGYIATLEHRMAAEAAVEEQMGSVGAE